LRAGFPRLDSGQAVQLIPRQVSVPWEEIDLAGLADGEADAEITRLTAREYAHRFDLSCPPLLRFVLVHHSPLQHRLIMTCHHILLDGWSMPVLVAELLALYAARGDRSGLPRVTPYRDYLAWLARQDRPAAELAWRQALAGLEQGTHLAPVDPARAPMTPEQISVVIPDQLTAALHDHARRYGLTLNTVMQGAWAVLLSRLSASPDVVFGAVVSGRPPELPRVETMIGLFINMVPVRVHCRPAQPLITTLTHNYKTTNWP
jgi:hypothetical protein